MLVGVCLCAVLFAADAAGTEQGALSGAHTRFAQWSSACFSAAGPSLLKAHDGASMRAVQLSPSTPCSSTPQGLSVYSRTPRRHSIMRMAARGEKKNAGAEKQLQGPESLREKGFVAARCGDAVLAFQLLSEYLSSPDASCSKDFAAMNCLGAMCAQTGKLDEAVNYFGQALAASEHDADEPEVQDLRANTLFNLGNACTALSRHSEALTAFEKSTLLRPTDSEAHVQIGNAHVALGNQPKALAAYERAVECDDTNPTALLNCGNALCDAGRPSEGVMMMMEALDAGAAPDLGVFLNIGVAARRAGMYDVAEDFLERVLELDASHVLARRLLRTLRSAEAGIEDGGSAEGEVSNVEEDAAYARMLFDEDAKGYENAMVTGLKYRAPSVLLEILLKFSRSAQSAGQKPWNRVM